MTAGGGEERYRRNRAAGIVDRAIGVHGSPEWNDYMAKEAEDFFARRYDLPFPGNRRPTEVEFVVAGCTIDVKWTTYPDGMLLHSMSSQTRAMMYVLIVGTSPAKFRMVGWQTGAALHASIVGPPDLPVPTYALRQWQLWPSVDLRMAALGCRHSEP